MQGGMLARCALQPRSLTFWSLPTRVPGWIPALNSAPLLRDPVLTLAQ